MCFIFPYFPRYREKYRIYRDAIFAKKKGPLSRGLVGALSRLKLLLAEHVLEDFVVGCPMLFFRQFVSLWPVFVVEPGRDDCGSEFSFLKESLELPVRLVLASANLESLIADVAGIGIRGSEPSAYRNILSTSLKSGADEVDELVEAILRLKLDWRNGDFEVTAFSVVGMNHPRPMPEEVILVVPRASAGRVDSMHRFPADVVVGVAVDQSSALPLSLVSLRMVIRDDMQEVILVPILQITNPDVVPEAESAVLGHDLNPWLEEVSLAGFERDVHARSALHEQNDIHKESPHVVALASGLENLDQTTKTHVDHRVWKFHDV